MKNLKMKFLVLIIGIACFACSSDNNKEHCEKGEHKSHHGKGHGRGHKGGKDGHFEKRQGFHKSMNPDSMAKFRTERMKEELKLTNEQVPKVEQVNLKYAQKMKEVREQMKKLEADRQKELEGILTNEQLEKLKLVGNHHRRGPIDSIPDEN